MYYAKNFEEWLQEEKILSAEDILTIRSETKNHIEIVGKEETNPVDK